jgi:hypothetical protein
MQFGTGPDVAQVGLRDERRWAAAAGVHLGGSGSGSEYMQCQRHSRASSSSSPPARRTLVSPPCAASAPLRSRTWADDEMEY